MRKAEISPGCSIPIIIMGFVLTAVIIPIASCDTHLIRTENQRKEREIGCGGQFEERVAYLTSHITEFSDNGLVSSAVSLLAQAYGSGTDTKRNVGGGEIRYESGSITAECSESVRWNPITARNCRGIILYDGDSIASEINVNYSKAASDGDLTVPELSYTFFADDGQFGYMIIYFPSGTVKYNVAKFKYEPGYAESVPVARYNVERYD